jgi:hypothetical protein
MSTQRKHLVHMSTQRKNTSFVHFDLMTCYFVKKYSNHMQVSYYKHIDKQFF